MNEQPEAPVVEVVSSKTLAAPAPRAPKVVAPQDAAPDASRSSGVKTVSDASPIPGEVVPEGAIVEELVVGPYTFTRIRY